MPLDAVAVLDRLKTHLEQTVGVGKVFIGVPEAPADQLVASISLAGATLAHHKQAGGTWQRRLRYRVELAYRVAGNEEAAERAVGLALDDFLVRILGDIRLGAPPEAPQSVVEWDLSQADAPEYRVAAGLEERVYPIVLGVDQVVVFDANQ